MTERSRITCPNGCSLDLMERDDHEGFPVRSIPPHAEYHCTGCGWMAIWRLGQPLDVIHNPRAS